MPSFHSDAEDSKQDTDHIHIEDEQSAGELSELVEHLKQAQTRVKQDQTRARVGNFTWKVVTGFTYLATGFNLTSLSSGPKCFKDLDQRYKEVARANIRSEEIPEDGLDKMTEEDLLVILETKLARIKEPVTVQPNVLEQNGINDDGAESSLSCSGERPEIFDGTIEAKEGQEPAIPLETFTMQSPSQTPFNLFPNADSAREDSAAGRQLRENTRREPLLPPSRSPPELHRMCVIT